MPAARTVKNPKHAPGLVLNIGITLFIFLQEANQPAKPVSFLSVAESGNIQERLV
jgi:hypothetical protein